MISQLGKMPHEEVNKANADESCWGLGEEDEKQDLEPCNKMLP